MEGGFKRLWSRKKSWGTNDQPPRQYRKGLSTGIISSPQPAVASSVRDGRPSMASTIRQYDQSQAMNKPGSSRDTPSALGDDLGRTKSGHRIQPMLVGISRPDTGTERPETAGSLQTAVQRAADSVGRRPSDVSHRTQPMPIKTAQTVQTVHTVQTTKPASRHVDIFSVAASIPSYRSRYNEEIAERNLDNYRLVLENTPYVYDPASKYQEEVAIRNAYLPYKSRTSTDTSRRSIDHERSASMTTRSIRSTVTPQPPSRHAYQPSTDSTVSTQIPPYEHQPSLHSRSLSQRSRDGTQLPSIPQEQVNEQAKLQREGAVAASAPPGHQSNRSLPPVQTGRENRMSTIAEGKLYESRNSGGAGFVVQRDSGYTSGNTFLDYKLSNVEQSNLSGGYRPGTAERPFDRAPSTRSTASSIKRTLILPNRTIMDLTSDDSELYSDASSAMGYSQYSPVVEQAHSDAIKKVSPSQIHTEERRSSKDPTWLAERTKSMVSTQAEDSTPSEEALTPVPATVATVDPIMTQFEEDRKSPVSRFSPVNTVASWSPRSSAYVTKVSEPLSMTSRAAAAIEASRNVITANPPPPPLSRNNSKEPQTVRQRVASFEYNNERVVTPPKATNEDASNHSQVTTKRPEETPARPIPQASAEVSTKTPATKTGAGVAQTPSIYTSPESITSVDYVNPSSAFGVRTRDFALSPREGEPSVKKAQSPAQRAKVAPPAAPVVVPVVKVEPRNKTPKPRTKQRTTPASAPKDSGFDEEAFARKQAEARAALERLQKSLSEDFITLPDLATVKNGKGKEVANEARASVSAPTIVPPQETKQHTANTSVQRTDSDKAPPSSFRTSREIQQRSSLTSNPRSLSSGSRSSRRAAAPSSLKNVEPATNPIDQQILSPALLQAMQGPTRPPKSPGEISLSSFPVPSSSRPPSQPDVPVGYHSHHNSLVGAMKRRNSTKSQGSTASAFSIPYHMVPGRTSSVRDPVPEEVDPVWG